MANHVADVFFWNDPVCAEGADIDLNIDLNNADRQIHLKACASVDGFITKAIANGAPADHIAAELCGLAKRAFSYNHGGVRQAYEQAVAYAALERLEACLIVTKKPKEAA